MDDEKLGEEAKTAQKEEMERKIRLEEKMAKLKEEQEKQEALKLKEEQERQEALKLKEEQEKQEALKNKQLKSLLEGRDCVILFSNMPRNRCQCSTRKSCSLHKMHACVGGTQCSVYKKNI